MTAAGPVACVPNSAVAGVRWPALPSPGASRLLALLQQLEHSQWWQAEVLQAWQMRQLGALLAHAAKTVPFYRDRLRAAGVAPRTPLTPDAWARIPILTRADLQGAGAALHSASVPAGHGGTARLSSSGSTGRPIEVLTTGASQLFWNAFTLRDHLWHRRDFGGKLASVRNYPDGKALYPRGLRARNWGPAVGAVYRGGPAVGLSITATTEQHVDWLLREDPDYLLTFPSVLRALLDHCRDRGVVLPRLREVRTISEVLAPETRAACQSIWGVPVTDAYSAVEVGYMALQCPQNPHYHVQAEGVMLEVVSEDGRPCGPGESGRVVVTPLHNFAMPLIRYALGDYAEPGPPCPCGRGQPVVTRIAGRVRNMLRLPGGGRIWPRLSEARYREVAPIRQFQMVQTSLARLEMRLVSDRPVTPQEEGRLREIILARLGHPFEIAFSYHAEIPRGPGGKYEDFKCDIDGA